MTEYQSPSGVSDEPRVLTRQYKKGLSGAVVTAIVVIVAIIAFTLGTRVNELAVMLGIPLASGNSLDLSSLQTTYASLKDKYDGQLDAQALIDGANRGLVEAAGDEYTVYMTKAEAEEFEKNLSGEIGGGIGAEIGMRSGAVTIVRVLDGNPAQAAGLKAGDQVVAVNDEPAADWTVEETVQAIRGEEGTSVKVTVLRAGEQREFTVTRAVITSPNVETKTVGTVGVIQLNRFDETAADETKEAARRLKAQGVRGIVLDMRGNGGGYLNAAQEIASIWLNDKVVVTERKNDKVVEELRSRKNPILEGMPTVVLVNGGSASASEIVAGALKDHGAATVVGEKTFGKGSVQQLVKLSGGAQLKVTVARWFTPSGKNLTKDGITPDQVVELTSEDSDKGLDPQLDAAVGRLNGA